MHRALAALFLLLFACASAPPPAREDAAAAAARADVQRLVAERKPPGLSVAVAVDGKLVWSEGFGFADVEQSVPATGATRYRLGSVSKLFTAAIAVRLASRGALDLDAPIQHYVATFPEKQAPITARQLLGHTAGIRHYLDSDPIFAGKKYASLADGLAIFAKDPLVFEPGSGYHYTSYGFNLLGVVLENAGARSFAQLLADEVTTPLGLDSVALDDPAAIVPNRSAFYAQGTNNAVINAAPNDSSYKWPSGGILASADDVARFASAHLGDGYLAEPLRSAMFVPQKNNVGLGWRVDTADDGLRYYHHGGTITGGRAFVLVLPEQRVAVAMLTNMLVRFDQAEALAVARRFIASP